MNMSIKHFMVRLIFSNCVLYMFLFLFGFAFFQSFTLILCYFAVESLLYHGFLQARIATIDIKGALA